MQLVHVGKYASITVLLQHVDGNWLKAQAVIGISKKRGVGCHVNVLSVQPVQTAARPHPIAAPDMSAV
jgi:hypothetical protein